MAYLLEVGRVGGVGIAAVNPAGAGVQSDAEGGSAHPVAERPGIAREGLEHIDGGVLDFRAEEDAARGLARLVPRVTSPGSWAKAGGITVEKAAR